MKIRRCVFCKKKSTTLLLGQILQGSIPFSGTFVAALAADMVFCEKVRQPILHVKRKSSLYVCYLPRIVSLTVKTHNTRIFNWMHRMFCSIELRRMWRGLRYQTCVFLTPFVWHIATWAIIGITWQLGKQNNDLKWNLRNRRYTICSDQFSLMTWHGWQCLLIQYDSCWYLVSVICALNFGWEIIFKKPYNEFLFRATFSTSQPL